MYGSSLEIGLSDIEDLVGNLEDVHFQRRRLRQYNSVNQLSGNGDPENPVIGLSIQERSFESDYLSMSSVKGKDVMSYLPTENSLMVVRLEYRARSNGKTTNHHLWIERTDSDPVINPRWEEYCVVGVSRDIQSGQKHQPLMKFELLEDNC